MAVDAVGGAARPKWSLTQEAFDGLLASFGPDRDETANRYLEVRRNLIRLFEWRGCSAPDELADETINRCARKIGEGEQIRDVPTYCIGIARMLLREAARERAREAVPWDRVPEPRTPPAEAGHDMDHREACLRRCLAQLSPENYDLILNYYQGDKGEKIRNRKELLRRFAIPPSTLRMRALRLRDSLQLCTGNCLQQRGRESL